MYINTIFTLEIYLTSIQSYYDKTIKTIELEKIKKLLIMSNIFQIFKKSLIVFNLKKSFR